MSIVKPFRTTGVFLSLLFLSWISPGSPLPRRPSGVAYLYPPDSARYVLPQSTIIVRLDHEVGPLPDPDSLFRVVGSVSGRHRGTIVVSEGKTVIFKPSTPFSWNENVRVDLAADALTGSADPSEKFSFVFRTSPGRVSVPSSLIRELSPSPGFTPPPPMRPMTKIVSTGSDSLPSDFPTAQVVDNGDTSSGLLFLDSFAFTFWATPYLMILEDDDTPVFYRAMTNTCTDFKIQPNGLLTYYDLDTPAYFELDSSYAIVDTFECGNGYSTDIHDLRLLPDGHALLLADDPEIVDMSKVVIGGNPKATVIGNIIQELDAQKNVVFQWRSWDHYGITDETHENLLANQIDYVHANALEIDTDGNILLSCRHMDEITKIDRVTGDIIWRWGGKHNQFRFLNDSLGFSHQHALRRIANGDFTLFDNGNFHNPPFSRAVEYSLDQTDKTSRLVWQYRNSPDIFGSAMGYVQRLPNGNSLICWGATNPSVSEVRPDGTKIYELNLPPGIFSYRAYRLNWNPGIVDGIAGSAPSPVPPEMRLDQNYPNPFNPTTVIRGQWTGDSNVRLVVYDVLGRQVATLADGRYAAGKYSFTFNANGLASGVYYYRLQAGNFTATKAMLLVR